ncbi:MAG: flagellar basal body protein [Hyphomicrobiaceae bacterium]
MMLSNFFSVASRHSDWLAEKRTAIASNIANANVPGYRTQSIGSFAQELDRADVGNDGWLSLGRPTPGAETAKSGSVSYRSGNDVSIDNELMEAGAVTREQMLNAGLTKAFNRLIALSMRG